MKLTLLALASSILLQVGTSPRDLLNLQRPLTVVEVSRVVSGIWEVFQRQARLGAIDFVYEQIDLRRPAGFEMPTCIP